MSEEKVFADGFILKQPHENAPDFVKGSLSIKADDAIKFIEANKDERGWINLDLKEGQSGKWYVEKNTWKPEKKEVDSNSGIGPEDTPF